MVTHLGVGDHHIPPNFSILVNDAVPGAFHEKIRDDDNHNNDDDIDNDNENGEHLILVFLPIPIGTLPSARMAAISASV